MNIQTEKAQFLRSGIGVRDFRFSSRQSLAGRLRVQQAMRRPLQGNFKDSPTKSLFLVGPEKVDSGPRNHWVFESEALHSNRIKAKGATWSVQLVRATAD